MRIVLWINGEANQRALACKIHKVFPLAGIVIEDRIQSRNVTPSKLISKIVEMFFLRSISNAWFGMMEYYHKQFASYPTVKKLNVKNINEENVYSFTNELSPDVIVVSGTGIVKDRLLSLKASVGIINLHTGLSPYVNGGPNCTNWCIATNQLHLIGNTVMWIDAGIDSGNLLTTETTEFDGTEDLEKVHSKVMDHAHELCVKAISFLESGGRSNVSQSELGKGKTYYSRQWGLNEKNALVANFKNFKREINSLPTIESRKKVKTIKII